MRQIRAMLRIVKEELIGEDRSSTVAQRFLSVMYDVALHQSPGVKYLSQEVLWALHAVHQFGV